MKNVPREGCLVPEARVEVGGVVGGGAQGAGEEEGGAARGLLVRGLHNTSVSVRLPPAPPPCGPHLILNLKIRIWILPLNQALFQCQSRIRIRRKNFRIQQKGPDPVLWFWIRSEPKLFAGS